MLLTHARPQTYSNIYLHLLCTCIDFSIWSGNNRLPSRVLL
jgi:hypothetical protein